MKSKKKQQMTYLYAYMFIRKFFNRLQQSPESRQPDRYASYLSNHPYITKVGTNTSLWLLRR